MIAQRVARAGREYDTESELDTVPTWLDDSVARARHQDFGLRGAVVICGAGRAIHEDGMVVLDPHPAMLMVEPGGKAPDLAVGQRVCPAGTLCVFPTGI